MDGDGLSLMRFAAASRVIAGWARAQGLDVPAFRCPPRDPNMDRSLRRTDDGRSVVSVRVVGRADPAWVRDMVAGLAAANGCPGSIDIINAGRRAVTDAGCTEPWPDLADDPASGYDVEGPCDAET